MTEIKYHKMPVRDEDGTLRQVDTITCNEDSVGNRIAEGYIQEADRYRELARLYKAQFIAGRNDHIARTAALDRKVAKLRLEAFRVSDELQSIAARLRTDLTRYPDNGEVAKTQMQD